MVGTIGPLVQGALPKWRWRLQITALFAIGFLVGAVAIFSLFFLTGWTLQIHDLSLTLRRSIAALGLVAFAALDVWARSKGSYCPVGLKRQTPRWIRQRHSMLVVALIWGFDTGLAATTFRVAATTWGALLFTLLGLSGWQTGIVYGVAFTIPMTVLMWTHPSGRAAMLNRPGDHGLMALLDARPWWQAKSALLQTAGAMTVLFELWRGAR